MKSLALHLLALLLLQLGSNTLHTTTTSASRTYNRRTAASDSDSALTSSAALSSSSALLLLPTTTIQPPSLRAPIKMTMPPTSAATAATTTTTAATTINAVPTATRRASIQPAARRASLAHANSNSNAVSDPATATAKTTTTTSAAASATSVRQNRSLQGAIATAQRSNSNGNNNNNNNGDNADIQKYKRYERRHHFRTNEHSGTDAEPPTATATTTATTTIISQTTPAAATAEEHQHQHQSLSTFMANHRQSKQQSLASLPLVSRDGDGVGVGGHAPQTKNNSLAKLPQTSKTPRMIQRLVAGHIQNAEGRSTYQVSAVSTNSSISNSTTTLKPAPSSSSSSSSSTIYFRRKQPILSSSYRHAKLSTTARSISPIATTTSEPFTLRSSYDSAEDRDDHDDDEALLDDPGDFDNWDNGILRLSAGSGKETTTKSKKGGKEDSKKTLSDQVRDGKYGLIEKELFRREPKRPGVLSYLPNKEVPIDNERNFGGLQEEDIWLAEDHLLVIKGGGLNEGELNEPWPPIDDYDAPSRQIKIPSHPKVPPPFPVQLEENGPVQFIGNNKFTVVYPVANESIPVYSAGPETNYASSDSDSDNEKNLLARPGSTQDPTEGGPGYLYPAPYPPWLYHNQTFVNPFLSNARPITFPGLGPFPLGRNGSLDNSNGTDYFDEDDPSLYYPPSYSFVYKSNYTNPVSPGPLVPGIVLPPPANQFSHLEKPVKSKTKTTSTTTTSTTPPPPPPAPPRHRVYTTTSTTTTSTTTTTTTPVPFRQIITKISEYTPKTINIAPASSPSYTPAPAPIPQPTRPTSPPQIEPVPVPVAVPVPVYPANNYPTSRPNVLTFVPTTTAPATETFSKSNPIYYEYFEAKRQPQQSTPNTLDDFLSTTVKPALVAQKPIKIYATSKRPFKQTHGHRNYLQPVSPQRQYVPENVVYITPKPEVRYKVPAAPQTPVFKPRPLENFEREVSAIRETLRYYQNQQLRDNSIPRTPKAKPLYEYSYEQQQQQQQQQPSSFQPPTDFDEQPFKPMVTYSPPVDDENAFHAIAYDKVDNEVPAAREAPKQQQHQQSKYQSTTTLVPVQPDGQYQSQQGRLKKHRLGAKYLQQPLIAAYEQQQHHNQQQLQQQPQQRSQLEYQTTPRTILTTQPPWISLQDKQELNEYQTQQQQQQPQHQQQYQSERLQLQPQVIAPKNRGFGGYYYGPPAGGQPPPPPVRQNNRFYDEPFQNPVRKIINYRPQQTSPQQQQPQQQQANIWSLENDTYVNYAPNRPPLNPDAEFINPYQIGPAPNPYHRPRLPQQQAPLSHQSQYYAPPQRFPQQQQQQQQHHHHQQHQHQRQPLPLHRDILVNYRQPLPPINPDSEYISHPQVVRNQANQIYRSNAYRLPPAPSIQGGNGGGEQSNIYYITPKYRRANNGNNGHSNQGADNNGK